MSLGKGVWVLCGSMANKWTSPGISQGCWGVLQPQKHEVRLALLGAEEGLWLRVHLFRVLLLAPLMLLVRSSKRLLVVVGLHHGYRVQRLRR